MKNNADYWIRKLNLTPHPEGGFFCENYRSKDTFSDGTWEKRYAGKRCFATSIYFLLKNDQISAFHKLNSDEIWHFYLGDPLILYMIQKSGQLTTIEIGNEETDNQFLQYVIPKDTWFGAHLKNHEKNSFSLIGCSVSPGFEFSDFQLAQRHHLLKSYPEYQDIIMKLTY